MKTQLAQNQGKDPLSVTERIAEVLSDRIVTGVLAPGTPVRQDHIAGEFQASHVPVREAFRMLEAQGLLVSEPRRGVRVAPLDPRAVIEVTEMRAALEVLALRYAFPHLTPDTMAEAKSALEEGEASGDVMVWERANRRFHQALLGPCGMPRLLGTIEGLHQASARFLFCTWQGLDWQSRSSQEHHAIMEALGAANLDQAERALKDHVLSAGQALAIHLEKA